MAGITEGTGNLPTDETGVPILGIYNNTDAKFYGLRADNSTAKNARVAFFDASGNALLVSGNPGYIKAADGDLGGVGATTDAIVAAGAAGSLSAKLRRATQGLEDLKTLIVLAAGGNVIGMVGARGKNTAEADVALRVAKNDGTTLTDGILALGNYLQDTTAVGWNPQRTAKSIPDGNDGGALPLVPIGAYNGATFDRLRTLAASGDGLGVLGTGRKGSTSTLFNALAIRDTLNHSTGPIDIGILDGYKTIYLKHNFDQPITKLGIYLYNGSATSALYYRTNLAITTDDAVLSSLADPGNGAGRTFIQIPQLAEPWETLELFIACAIAPTTGTVTAKMRGVM